MCKTSYESHTYYIIGRFIKLLIGVIRAAKQASHRAVGRSENLGVSRNFQGDFFFFYSCQNLGREAIAPPLPPYPVPTAQSQSRQTWHIKLSIYAWIPTLDSRFGKVASVQIHRSVSVYDNWCFADGTFRNFHTWFFALKDTYDSWPSTEGLCCSLQARWNNFKVGWDQEF